MTTFSRADGFATIGRHEEIVQAGTIVDVQLLGRDLQLADLVVIGSHCIALDYLLGELQRQGVRSKFLAVGSTGGLDAAKRGECDIAGVHLLDPKTNEYNRPFPDSGARTDSAATAACRVSSSALAMRAFEGRSAQDAIASALADPACVMVNRNQGSGTRVLIDRLLDGGQTARVCRAAAKSQRRRRRRSARPRRLGNDARYHRPQRRTRISAGAGGAVRFHRAAVARGSAGVVAFRTLLEQPSTREALAAWE